MSEDDKVNMTKMDSYLLTDAEALSRAHASFQIPPLEARERLCPGDFAKLIFVPAVKPHPDYAERMWVEVKSVTAPGEYVGELNNWSFARHLPDLGAEVVFSAKHIVDIKDVQ